MMTPHARLLGLGESAFLLSSVLRASYSGQSLGLVRADDQCLQLVSSFQRSLYPGPNVDEASCASLLCSAPPCQTAALNKSP